MAQASIETDKIVVDGTPCRKIMCFVDVLDFGALPEQYTLQGLSFYLVRSSGGYQNPSRWNGKRYVTWDVPKDTPLLCITLPPDIGLVGMIESYDPYIYVGSVLREDTFQDIMMWLKRAGARLAKIRRKQTQLSAWSGCEIVKI